MYLHISKTECKTYNRRVYFLYKDQKRSIPHRYAFVHMKIVEKRNFVEEIQTDNVKYDTIAAGSLRE